jgi:hypothetical protein
MSIKRSKRLLAFLIALVMALTGFVTAMPLEAAASDWDTEHITDVYILAETTRSVTVSFHLSHNITHTDPGRLAVGLYLHDKPPVCSYL